MSETQETKPAAAVRGLRIDLRATLLSVAVKLPIVLLCAAVAGLFAKSLSTEYASSVYHAETLIRFRPNAELGKDADEKTIVVTLKDTVKTRSNVDDVRSRVGFTAPVETVGKAIEVEVIKNTTLMRISADWSTGKGAAALARAMRDVFLEHYRSGDRRDADNRIASLQRQLEGVRNLLREKDADLETFTAANKIVDIEKQSRAMLEEYNNYGVLLEQAQADRKTVEQQSAQLDKIVAELKDRVARESKSIRDMETLSDVKIRIEQIKEAIADDKKVRVDEAELRLREQEMARYKMLMEIGAISEADYERAVTAHEKAKIAAIDTVKDRGWREELERLKGTVIPQSGGDAPSMPVLRETLIRSLDIQLQKVAVIERVRSLSSARSRVQILLDRIPAQQREFDTLSRDIATLEAERKDLEERLSQARRVQDLVGMDFGTVTDADVPKRPMKSNKMMLAAGILMGGLFVGLLLVIGLEALDRTVRCTSEARLHTGLEPLGSLPACRLPASEPWMPPQPVAERFSMAARRLRQAVPQEGARILLAGVTANVGAGAVVQNLAVSLARQDERVLVIDARSELTPGMALWAGDAPEAGLALALASEGALAGAVLPTGIDGVSLLTRGGADMEADSLASERMARLLREASAAYTVVLVLASPVREGVEAELLAHNMDASALVIRSRFTRRSDARQAAERLGAAGKPVAGVLLNRVSRLFITRDA
ncbi:MAG: hypothetical protein NT029_21650 [Armatimonadetes bacterium]|nr:hypothetical protein [Armatimonadota bacterium]